MTGDSLARAADELYAIAPAGFTAARDERARQARAAGDRKLAAAIAGLRRPTVAAWLVNLLSREAPDQVSRLAELGGALAEAQQALAGDRLRELSGQRRRLVTALAEDAMRLAAEAGHPASPQVQRELEATFDAALADPEAASAVRSGRLARALSYAGMGGADVAGALALPAGPAEPAGPPQGRAAPRAPAARDAPARQRGRRQDEAAPVVRDLTAKRRAREAEAGGRALQEAAAAARDAQAAHEDAEREAAAALARQQANQRRMEELMNELAQCQAAAAELARAAREAARRRDRADRSLAAAQRRLAAARDQAGEPG